MRDQANKLTQQPGTERVTMLPGVLLREQGKSAMRGSARTGSEMSQAVTMTATTGVVSPSTHRIVDCATEFLVSKHGFVSGGMQTLRVVGLLPPVRDMRFLHPAAVVNRVYTLSGWCIFAQDPKTFISTAKQHLENL